MSKKKSIVKRILEVARKNPEGFTAKLTKDGRIILLKGSQKNRYAVSKTNYDTKKKIKKAFKNFKSGYFGGWYDKDTGKYYIDKNKVVSNKKKALKIAKKYNQKAIFDLVRKKEINVKRKSKSKSKSKYKGKSKLPIVRKNGKWYNKITGKYVSKRFAKRIIKYFKEHPSGVYVKARGEYQYKPDVKVRKQSKKIRDLWKAKNQVITTRTMKGKKVYYSPFYDEIVKPKDYRRIKRFDYTICGGKIKVHLYRLATHGQTVYHIFDMDVNQLITDEFEYQSFIDHTITPILECLTKEMIKVSRKHRLADRMQSYGHIGASLYSAIDFYKMGANFGEYTGNKEGIELTMVSLLSHLRKFADKLNQANYHRLYINRISFYLRCFYVESNPQAKISKYRIGILNL